MSANPYSATPEQQQANDLAALAAAAFLAEMRGRRLTRRQLDLQTRAERLARWLSRQDAKGGSR